MVAVESPTYYGLLQVVESLQLKTLEIPCSPRTGLSIEALELAFQTQPRLVARTFPLGTRMSLPAGGLCLWVELPEGFSSAALFGEALEQGIRIAPGSMFSNSGRYEQRPSKPGRMPSRR